MINVVIFLLKLFILNIPNSRNIKNMLILKVVYFLVIVRMCSMRTTSREAEGYPVGYLSDCKYK